VREVGKLEGTDAEVAGRVFEEVRPIFEGVELFRRKAAEVGGEAGLEAAGDEGAGGVLADEVVVRGAGAIHGLVGVHVVHDALDGQQQRLVGPLRPVVLR